MRFLTTTWLLIGSLSIAVPMAHGQDLVEPLSVDSQQDTARVDGNMDWTGGVLTVYGEGVAPESIKNPVQRRLMGFTAAKLVAYRNLLELIGEVHVDANTTVSMAMVSSDSIRTRVEGIIKGACVLADSREESNGLYRLAVALDVHGEFADAVLPVQMDGEDATAEAPFTGELPEADSVIVFVPRQPYTGLIIDARGTDLRPAMSPRILDTRGRVIYSADHVDRDYAVKIGIVGYDRDLARAAVSDRLGGKRARPMIVDAEETTGLYGGDVVISNDNGLRLRLADAESGFLADCRVTFVVGPKPPPVVTSFFDTAVADSVMLDSLGRAPSTDEFDEFDEFE